MIVIGAGTGGTITGVSRAIKKRHNPDCVVVGVDPVGVSSYQYRPLLINRCLLQKGSVLARSDVLNEPESEAKEVYQVEGIGYAIQYHW